MFHISVLCNNHKVKLRIKMIWWCFEFKWHTVQVYFIQFCANTNKYDDEDDKSMLNVEIAKKFVPETLSLSLKIYTIDTCVCVFNNHKNGNQTVYECSFVSSQGSLFP